MYNIELWLYSVKLDLKILQGLKKETQGQGSSVRQGPRIYLKFQYM